MDGDIPKSKTIMKNLKNQKDLMEIENWDCLIILDACRYDYFEKVYGDYLDGNLRKVKSVGSNTDEWLRNIFDEKKYKDVIYVSANPRINSKGIKVVDGFDGTKYFYNIIDVWDEKWNNELGTVLPKHVSKFTRTARAKYPNYRIIAHFMQPHFPYLPLGESEGFSGVMLHVSRRGGEMRKNPFIKLEN